MFYRIALPAVLLASLGNAQQCSLDSIRGAWASTAQATFMITDPTTKQVTPTPAAILNVGTIDREGSFVGTTTGMLGGQPMVGTYKGAMQVNPDCTGTATGTVTFPGMPPMTMTERGIIQPDGTEIRAMSTGPLGALGGVAGIEHFSRISWGVPQCTQEMVHGVYAATYEGTWIGVLPGQTQPAPYPYSQIGVAVFDYSGKGSGALTMSAGVASMDFDLSPVTVAVNADCTGTLNWAGSPRGMAAALTGTTQIVVLNNGDDLLELPMQTNSGPLMAIGTAKRISTVPVLPNW